MMYDKLICFDFDGTLFHTPDHHEGRRIWREQTGFEFPHTGWWGKSETLNTEVFYIPVNEWVLARYKEAIADPKAYVILATGRLQKVRGMRENVEKILADNNITFNEVHLNWGGDTFNFKTKLFEQLMAKLKVKEFTMYDDRHEHLVKFKHWAVGQRADVKIVDVLNKRTTTIENL
jgi:hypothetical protein